MNRLPNRPFADFATEVSRPVPLLVGSPYRSVGVKWYGEGVHVYETRQGQEFDAARFSICAGDLIYNDMWARKGSVAIVPPELDGAVASSHFPTFELDTSVVEPRYVHWYFKTPSFWDHCENASRGSTGRNQIKRRTFLAIPIPLPPLAEQRRVVARIEELAAQIHEARTLRQQAAEEAEALAASSLFSLLPRKAPIRKLADLLAHDSKLSYGVLVPGPDVEGGIPFVRIQDLAIKNAPAAPAKRIAPEIDRQYARTRLKGGEVLIGVVGSIGKIGIAPSSWAGANIARAVCRIVPGHEVDRDYLAAVLSAQPSQDYFRETTRTLAQPTLNVGQLAETPIPVPLLSEQRRIVAELDALQAQVDALKRLQAETAAELDALLPAILDRAFKGEL